MEQPKSPPLLDPVGQGEYVVLQGECLSTIAERTGHTWQTIWNDPNNAELKRIRKDPNTLIEGDRLTIPDLRMKKMSVQTTETTRFVRKSIPPKFRIRFMTRPEWEVDESTVIGESEEAHAVFEDPLIQVKKESVPLANEPYVLDIDGVESAGYTDDEGIVEVFIPSDAKKGVIILAHGSLSQTVRVLNFGALRPIEDEMGIRQRLLNLGFPTESPNGDSDLLFSAVVEFQILAGLTPTGTLDQPTIDRLLEWHGS